MEDLNITDKKIIKNNKLKNELKQLTPDQIKNFSFDGIDTYAKVITCFEGNKIAVVFKFNKRFIKYNCLIKDLDHIDMCYLHSRDLLIKKKAIDYKSKLEKLILNKIVSVKFGSFDKFGRIITDVYYKDKKISDEMK